jgi:hypothetical protein
MGCDRGVCGAGEGTRDVGNESESEDPEGLFGLGFVVVDADAGVEVMIMRCLLFYFLIVMIAVLQLVDVVSEIG